MSTLIIVNGSAYGLDSTDNAIRLADNPARGITSSMLVPDAARSTMDELGDHTLAADKVLVF